MEKGIKRFNVDDGLLYDFQKEITSWALRMGRCAIFADCGLGKTPIQLTWAQKIVEHENKPILVLTPLAVSQQTIREGEKFGIDCERSSDGNFSKKIVVTNYERLHYFNENDFIGVVADESGCLKNFDGKRQKQVNMFMKKIKYRLLCTATAAPNDYIELGTSSEILGQMGRMDMLGTFFKNDEKSLHPIWWGARWRFKAHAETKFWRWVCSWAKALRKPSDVGKEFEKDDKIFELPKLKTIEHVVDASRPMPGRLFVETAKTLQEQREERRLTINERCEKAANIVDNDKPAVIWGHLCSETNLLEKIIPDAKQVEGKNTDEYKEGTFLDFVKGSLRVLICKPKIGAWGLNWQHCSNVVSFPSHSYEQWYQSIRRCWRFGQKNDVVSNLVTTKGEQGVLLNLKRKEVAASKMFDKLIDHMNDVHKIDPIINYGIKKIEVPEWM